MISRQWNSQLNTLSVLVFSSLVSYLQGFQGTNGEHFQLPASEVLRYSSDNGNHKVRQHGSVRLGPEPKWGV